MVGLDGIGILLEIDEHNRKILVYCLSHKPTKNEINYYSSKLKLLAIVWCIADWDIFVQRRNIYMFI